MPLFLASFETLNLSVSNFTVLIFESLLATMTAPIAATVTNVPPRMAPIFLPKDQDAKPLVFDLRPRLYFLYPFFSRSLSYHIYITLKYDKLQSKIKLFVYFSQ